MSVLIPNSDPNNFEQAFNAEVSTETFVNETQSSVLLLGENSNRKKAIIINESNRNMFMSFNSPAVRRQGIVMAPGDVWIEEHYIGDIFGIWSNGADEGARLIELT